MVILSIKRHKLPKVILGVCLIGLIGFKDTGMFVKDFTAVDGSGNKEEFNKYENINLLSERDENYLIEKEGSKYTVPSNSLIRTSKTTQKYRLLRSTAISDKPLELGFKVYYKGDEFQLLKYQEEYGFFQAEDGEQGYIKLTDLEPVVEDYYTYGTSKVSKVIKNGDIYYTLIKGQSLAIKDFEDNNFIIVDENENEIKVPSEDIELKRRVRQMASRSNISNRSENISKVVESAHKKLGSRYVYGDTGRRGYDCSGLTYSIYSNELGIKLNRSSIDQARNGIHVDRKDLVPGDLVFFKTSARRIGHVGLYIGEGNMIHASSSNRKVMVTNINSSNYYTSRFVTARRIIK